MKKIYSVLIVEDEALNAMNLKFELNETGDYDCTVLSSEDEIFEFLKKQVPDLLIMDIYLEGEVNGIEIVKSIHKKYIIPVIFMTGLGIKDVKEQIFQFKNSDLIQKPVSITHLIAIMKKMILN